MEALDRVAEEGLPCRLRHGGVRGGLVGVCGGAGADLLEGVHPVHPFARCRSPGPLHPAAELLQSGGRPPGEVGRGRGGGGSELGVLEWREEEVDIRRWRAWRRLGELERRWRGLGVEDGYGRQGERVALWGSWGEGEVDMGRRWRALRRPGERERRWRGLEVEDGYGRRGERVALWGLWGEGEVDMGRRWRACWRPGERERRWQGLGVEDRSGRWGEREALWGSWGGGGGHGAAVARVGARAGGSCGSGALGGLGGASGSGSGASERLRRGGGVGSASAGAGWAVRGGSGRVAVCGTGPCRGTSRASQEVSAGPGGPRVLLPGTRWGGGGSPALHGSAAAGGTGGVTVAVGVGLWGPLRHGRVGRGDTVPGTGGPALGGRRGMGVERPVAAIPYASAAGARGVVARWGTNHQNLRKIGLRRAVNRDRGSFWTVQLRDSGTS